VQSGQIDAGQRRLAMSTNYPYPGNSDNQADVRWFATSTVRRYFQIAVPAYDLGSSGLLQINPDQSSGNIL
jgi:hypothetical protein